MKTDETILNGEMDIKEWMEQTRSFFSHMIKEYLRMYKKYDRLKTIVQGAKSINYYDFDGISFLDENGKINWDIIRQFIPKDMDTHIQKTYKILNDNEVRLCCLLFFKIPYKDIAEILPYKERSIHVKKRLIKQKTGLQDWSALFRFITLDYLNH